MVFGSDVGFFPRELLYSKFDMDLKFSFFFFYYPQQSDSRELKHD